MFFSKFYVGKRLPVRFLITLITLITQQKAIVPEIGLLELSKLTGN